MSGTRPGAIAAAFALAAALVGCAHTPRRPDTTPLIHDLREHYARTHPASPWMEAVERGEVRRGMRFAEVLAAWGIPQVRRRVVEKDGPLEYWTYADVDTFSGDWTRTTFVFERNTLVDWTIVRHVNKDGGLVDWRLRPGRARIPTSGVALDRPTGAAIPVKH